MEIVYLPYQIDGINLHIKEVLNQVLSTYYIKSKNCYDKVGIWQTLTTPSKTSYRLTDLQLVQKVG